MRCCVALCLAVVVTACGGSSSPTTDCKVAGDPCMTPANCCMQTPVLFCLTGKCAPQACATSADCMAGYTCPRSQSNCVIAMNLHIGEPCTADAQCASRSCSAWCTKPCTTDADCGSGNSCQATTTGGSTCFPNCKVAGGGATNCAVYGAGYACQATNSLGIGACSM